MVDSAPREGVRTAEIAAALSLAIDHGMGSPLEQGMHAALLGARIARTLGRPTPPSSRSSWWPRCR